MRVDAAGARKFIEPHPIIQQIKIVVIFPRSGSIFCPEQRDLKTAPFSFRRLSATATSKMV
ncbi:hypothetical protein ASD31_22600 [Rhizobium sp. Root482]|nr:hypothetical protein ASD31_22600 [Rhizobium sp. Root482]